MDKRIVCFGDSNTWGYDADSGGRFSTGVRWPTILQRYLGEKYSIVEEGLPGRTAVVDDPLNEGLNGLTYIHPCLMSHKPLEWVVLMLGTNDTKERFALTAANIAGGITRLARKIQMTAAGLNDSFAKILVVAPPAIEPGYINSDVGATMWGECDKKSESMPAYLATLLNQENIPFLNLADKVEMNDIDFMHFTKKGHEQTAAAIYEKLKQLL